ncbi:MAG: DUF6804 family protein [Flavobacteriales bacterium]
MRIYTVFQPVALGRELWNIVDVIVAVLLIWDGSRKGR